MSRAPPRRHWRSYGNDPLPTGREAWTNPSPRFRRGSCASPANGVTGSGLFNEAHSSQRAMLIRDILGRMRHDGCGGRAGKAELLTGIEGVSSGPVRKIVLRES